jgi:hypothetical protein
MGLNECIQRFVTSRSFSFLSSFRLVSRVSGPLITSRPLTQDDAAPHHLSNLTSPLVTSDTVCNGWTLLYCEAPASHT